jgi:hypothetical protein
MRKRVILLPLLVTAAVVAVWVVLRSNAANRNRQLQPSNSISYAVAIPSAEVWARAVEEVKAERTDATCATSGIEIPPELKHYSDRHWFLATQVAEIEKYHIQNCEDYFDLAAMLQRGEMVSVPWVTDTYVLYGVGAKADDGAFTTFEDDHSVELYSEAQVREMYQQLDEKRSDLETEIASLRARSARLNKRDRPKQSELQKEITVLEGELKATAEKKALLDQFYSQPNTREELLRNYDLLQSLAKNFGGRSYNIEVPSDRQTMKVNMLSSLRPQALRILEEVASAYHQQFHRPLPVSSLVRPEQYQHALRRVNRNAVLIETPPHSTGLAFDIDYRYMCAAEQTFLMAVLARLKNEGRIEVIRERNANYHVFAFLNGTRPGDDLITAALDKASVSGQETHDAADKATKLNSKPKPEKHKAARSKKRRR